MRRASGRRPCRPEAIPGEIVAAKARAVYASRGTGPAYTGSIKAPISIGTLIKGLPEATPGEDGFVDGEDGDDTTGSIGEVEAPAKPAGGSWFAACSAQTAPVRTLRVPNSESPSPISGALKKLRSTRRRSQESRAFGRHEEAGEARGIAAFLLDMRLEQIFS